MYLHGKGGRGGGDGRSTNTHLIQNGTTQTKILIGKVFEVSGWGSVKKSFGFSGRGKRGAVLRKCP